MKRHALCLAAFIALAAIVAPETAWAQCAMCRRALASPEGQHLVAAFRRGIAVLLAAPFTLFAVVAFFALRAQRRRRGDVQEAS
jgi:hypothetical protein